MEKSKVFKVVIGILLLFWAFTDIHGILNKDSETITGSIGEYVSDKNEVRFCVTSIEDTTAISDRHNTDDNFIVLTIKIDNAGKEAYDVNCMRFKLIADDAEYKHYSNTVFALEDALYMDTLNPGISREYRLVYETPFTHTEKNCKLKILDSAFSNRGIFINLN